MKKTDLNNRYYMRFGYYQNELIHQSIIIIYYGHLWTMTEHIYIMGCKKLF